MENAMYCHENNNEKINEMKTKTLDMLRDVIPVDAMTYCAIGKDYNLSEFSTIGVPSDRIESYRRHFWSVDPLHARHHFFKGENIFDIQDFEAAPGTPQYVGEHLAPMGYAHEANVYLRDSGGSIFACVALVRKKRSGAFTANDIGIVKSLIPMMEYVAGSALTNGAEPQKFADLCQLTARERDVVSRLATGYSNKEIARQLDVSLATVKTHLINIFGKTGVRSRSELTFRYAQSDVSVRCRMPPSEKWAV